MKDTRFLHGLRAFEKPARYIGGELNLKPVDFSAARVSALLVFPDIYEIGMSHAGFLIVHNALVNAPGAACDRAFLPWKDAWDAMKAAEEPIRGLASGRRADEFDLICMSIPHELAAANVAGFLELARVPMRAANRAEDDPIVVAGGSGIFNPEPLAPFFDAMFFGDGEEGAVEIASAAADAKSAGLTRAETLEKIGKIPGVYMPSWYEPVFSGGVQTGLKKLNPNAPDTIRRRVIPGLDAHPLPMPPLVPAISIVHDRLTVEIARGCTHGCRFCQAGMTSRPVRERNPAVVLEYALGALKRTGFEEVSLLSLSSGDYGAINWLVKALMQSCAPNRQSVSLPSLHPGTLDAGTAAEIRRVRKTGFTLAPEAGTARLRALLNKHSEDAVLLEDVRSIAAAGWKSVKLYFMLGLPTETDEDVRAIASLAAAAKSAGLLAADVKGSFSVTVSAGTFIPKAHTPFQWEEQLPEPEALRRIMLLKDACKRAKVELKWQDTRMSAVEGVLARGDRRAADAVEHVARAGGRFCSWGAEFNYGLWVKAFADAGIDFASALGGREPNAPLPWDHVDTGVSKKYLAGEFKRAYAGIETPDCRRAECSDCGACIEGLKPVVHKAPAWMPPPAPRSETPKPARAEHPRTEGARPPDGPNVIRYRIGYGKRGALSLVGHLELKTAIERAFRRGALPIKFSAGFHPHMKIAFGPALPLGVESVGEWMDAEFSEKVPEEEIIRRLGESAPVGIEVFSAYKIPGRFLSIEGALKEFEYEADLSDLFDGGAFSMEDADRKIREFLEAKTLPVQRGAKEGRSVDIRPLVLSAELTGNVIKIKASARGPGHVKITAALAAILGISAGETARIIFRKTGSSFTYDD